MAPWLPGPGPWIGTENDRAALTATPAVNPGWYYPWTSARRLSGLPVARRSQRYDPPWVATAPVVTLDGTPAACRTIRSVQRFARVSRGPRFVPLAADTPITRRQVQRRVVASRSKRRSEAPSGSVTPIPRQGRTRAGVGSRRGRRAESVSLQAVPQPPSSIGKRRLVAPAAKGHRFDVVPQQVVVIVTPQIVLPTIGKRRLTGLPARGHLFAVVPSQVVAPKMVPVVVRSVPRPSALRRGKRFDVVPPQVVIPPPVLVPPIRVEHLRLFALQPRGHYFLGWLANTVTPPPPPPAFVPIVFAPAMAVWVNQE